MDQVAAAESATSARMAQIYGAALTGAELIELSSAVADLVARDA